MSWLDNSPHWRARRVGVISPMDGSVDYFYRTNRRWTTKTDRVQHARYIFISKTPILFFLDDYFSICFSCGRLGRCSTLDAKNPRHPIDNLTWACQIRRKIRRRRRKIRSYIGSIESFHQTITMATTDRTSLLIFFFCPFFFHSKNLFVSFLSFRSISWSVPSGQDFDFSHQLSNVDVRAHTFL